MDALTSQTIIACVTVVAGAVAGWNANTKKKDVTAENGLKKAHKRIDALYEKLKLKEEK